MVSPQHSDLEEQFSHHSDSGSDEIDEEEWWVQYFGDSNLVRYARQPSLIRKLLAAGEQVTANAVIVAIEQYSTETLKILLDAGADPNGRRENVPEPDPYRDTSIVEDYYKKRNWYPIQYASHLPVGPYENKCQRDAMICLLIEYEANIYTTYHAEVDSPPRSSYPGEDEGDKRRAIGVTLQETRSIIHSIFEDGGSIAPFLHHPNLTLDLESRNSQGCTLLLSICHNPLGADAAFDVSLQDCSRVPGIVYWKGKAHQASETLSSLFRALERRGANLLAVDDNGKHILHHIFETRFRHGGQHVRPIIHDTLRHILKRVPASLINQPDHEGTYPLHSALRLWRSYPDIRRHGDDERMMSSIIDLLAAGADLSATDGHGNTALHYLADDGLADSTEEDHRRQLCRILLEKGVDVNIRNNSGRSALDMLLDINKQSPMISSRKFRYQDKQWSSAIDEELFEMFDQAGIRWNDQDLQGRSPLHIVAMHDSYRTVPRADALLERGVDPLLQDNDGKTAREYAKENNTESLLIFFKEIGIAQKEKAQRYKNYVESMTKDKS